MIDQTITTPPPAPSSNDIPNFKERFDVFLAWMVVFVSQLVTLISQINSTATTVNEKEASAVNSAQVAVSAANFKGTYTTQTTQGGESYLWNGAIYMVLVAGNTSPTTSPSNWFLIPKINSVNGFTPDASGNVKVEATKGVAIASASTITIGTAGLGDTIHITGTTTITSLGNATAGVMRTLIFDGILTLTHHATSLILPDSANITTAVGDSAEFVCDTTNNWKLLRYTRAITPTKVLTFSDMPAGTVIQTDRYLTGGYSSGTTIIPLDNTIPQITEGTQFMSLTFTPKKANSKLKITAVGYFDGATSIYGISALFRDSTANAIASSCIFMTDMFPQILTAYVDAVSTSPTTFTVRAGTGTAGTIYFNGINGSPYFNGTLASNITIEEIAQ